MSTIAGIGFTFAALPRFSPQFQGGTAGLMGVEILKITD